MGAFDATTSVTDGVTDNLAQYHNELKTAADHTMSAAAYAAYGTPASMTGNVTLTDASLPILSYAPTAARDLTLPAVATTNHAFYVINRSGTYAITVKDAAAATITTVAINSTAFLVSDGANSWYPMGGALSKAAGSDVATGTDDAKYVTSKAIKDSVNVPNVAPSTSGNVLTSNGTAWTSAAANTGVGDGWTAISATGTSGTLDAPSFEISFNADMTGIIGLGDRIKITQATTKYFIVTKVGAFGGGATIITCYGGTDYTLVATATTAITAPYLSHVKNPFGFPLSPIKWTAAVVSTTDWAQATPTAGTWYNLGSISISLPIGIWNVSYQAMLLAGSTSALRHSVFSTLSTANNSESDVHFTSFIDVYVAASNQAGVSVFRYKTLAITSKQSHYFNTKVATANCTNVYNINSTCPFILQAVCAYL